MSTINEKISKKITHLMSEQHLQVKDLSTLSDLSEKTLHNLLDCSITPSINMLKKICNVFSLNTCEFFDDIVNGNLKTEVC